ncbi:MAG: ATP-binding protein [Solirubrobacteraceae bacterium]
MTDASSSLAQLATAPQVVRFQARFPAIAMGVAAIRGEMTAVAYGCGFSPRRVADVQLAVSEAATNAVIHAFPGEEEGPIEVTARLHDQWLQITIADFGAGTERPTARRLGLEVIKRLCDDFELVGDRHGTAVHMYFARA